jgi:DNA-binding transcriptional MerR regulator
VRVGELSRRSGISLPSIKYYLREGLLPPGERTGPNQASYDEHHLRRLRLVRALIDVGGLSVAASREVLAAVDEPDRRLHDVLGQAQVGFTQTPPEHPAEAAPAAERARKRLDELLARRGWRVSGDNPARQTAVEVLMTYERLDQPDLLEMLDAYAEAIERLAHDEVALVVAQGERERVVESAVVGTVLGDTLLGALRRMAHEHASVQLLAPGGTGPG